MRLLLLFFMLSVFVTAPAQEIIYIDPDAGGSNNGSSWTDAFTDLQTAVNSAATNDTLWVKSGTYIPNGTARTSSFRLKPGITVLGGFAGTETDKSQRNFVHNLTILSGNIGDETTDADNCYHVLNLKDVNCNGTILDGFHIRDGKANGESYDYRGGGIHLYGSGTVTFINCVISDNTANYGGGVCISYNSDAIFENVVFYKNRGEYDGGAIHTFWGNPTLKNCIVVENTCAREYNGVLETYSGKPFNIYNTTILGNSGNAIKSDATTKVYNSIVSGSITGSVGFQYSYKDGTAMPGEGNISGELMLSDQASPMGADGLWFTGDDGLQLTFDSPARNAGANDLLQENQISDLIGLPRINGHVADMGAYEFDSSPLFSNQTIKASTFLNSGDFVGRIEANDPDDEIIVFEVVGGAEPYFLVDESSGTIVVNDISSLDDSQTQTIDLTIRVHDPISSVQATVTVGLIPQNPPMIEDQSFSVDENSPVGDIIGSVTATGGDLSPVAYSLMPHTHAEAFNINETTGELSIADSSTFNFEDLSSLEIEVAVSDGLLQSTAVITININNLDEAPVVENYNFFVSQQAENMTVVGQTTAVDPEGSTISYAIGSGNESDVFSIDSNTGQIILRDNSLLDCINMPIHVLSINASDGIKESSYPVNIYIEAPANPNIIYVNKDAFGNNDGTSWLNAYTDLQTAVNSAATNDTLWVKSGTYLPNGTARASTFKLKPGIAVLGGFAGTETDKSQRDFVHNLTILSGNIGDETTDADNCYHVLNLKDVNCNGAILDGVHIRDGKANGESYDYMGGGIHLYGSGTVTFINCVISDNTANYGGGVCISYDSDAIFENVVFYKNRGEYDGGAIHTFGGNPTLKNCIVVENTCAREYNGVLETYSGKPFNIYNTTIFGNSGNAIKTDATTKVYNSIVSGSVTGSVDFQYSCKDGTAMPGEGNISGELMLLDQASPMGDDGLWFTEDDGLQLTFDSPARNAGSEDITTDIETDILGNPRNIALSPDMGAFEFVSAPYIITAENTTVAVHESEGTPVTNIIADDYDSEAITYSIESGNTDEAFSIDTSTGEIKVKTPSAIDIDTNPVFNLSVTVSDGQYTDEASLTISVTKLPAQISMNESIITYNGVSHNLAAQTTPAGLQINYTYNGETTLPSAAGEYEVVATISDNVYDGVATANLIIKKALLTATANDAVKTYGEENPGFSISYGGFVNNEDENSITRPAISCSADAATGAGSIPISLSGGSADNYETNLVDGKLTINKALLTVAADNKTSIAGQEIPELTYTFSGFVNDEDENALISLPEIATNATAQSAPGKYAITLSAGDADNYNFSFVEGILTIELATGITDKKAGSEIILWPNPFDNVINIKNIDKIVQINIYDTGGSLVLNCRNPSKKIDVSQLKPGLYILKVIKENNSLTHFFRIIKHP